MNTWNASLEKMWRNFLKDMRPTWAVRLPRRWSKVFFTLARKAIDMVIKVDDVEALQNDLQKDFVINSTLSSVAGNMVLRCGRLVAVANAALITVWHINFEKKPAKEPEKEPAKEPVQEPWEEADLATKLPKFSHYNIHGWEIGYTCCCTCRCASSSKAGFVKKKT